MNNGVMQIFFNAKYEISGQKIENINNPGIVILLIGTAKFSFDYLAGAGSMQSWASNTADNYR